MSLTGGGAVTQALQFIGRLFPTETPNSSELNDGLTVANQILANIYNAQVQGLKVLVSEQSQTGSGFIAKQNAEGQPLLTAYALAGGSLTPPSYTNGSYTPGSLPAFSDLSTPETFPTGYDLVIVLELAKYLASVYSVGFTDAMAKNLADAWAAASPTPGRPPIPGTGFQGAVPPGPQAA